MIHDANDIFEELERPPSSSPAGIVTVEEFAAVDEPGAEPLVGDPDSILIPQGGDIMIYGDGGAGKTTLSIDLACHLAAGDPWLGIPVSTPARVLMIENEGPRALFRRKWARKLASWPGSSLNGRVQIFSEPWAEFTFAADSWRAKLAATIAEHEIDVLIAGPLTRLGMNEAGTLQQVREFLNLVAIVRRQSGRRLTDVLVHHENKGGQVSGAWEGSGDTLLHVQNAGNGHTVVLVQKARWASDLHGHTLKLQWTAGEGFELENERDYHAAIVALLQDGVWRTADTIRAEVKAGANRVKELLETDRFVMRTGEDAKALGQHPNRKLYQLAEFVDSTASRHQLTPTGQGWPTAGVNSRLDSKESGG